MFYHVSGEAVVWAIVGGAGTLLGPLVGTTLFIIVREVVSTHWEHHSLIVGTVAILVVIFAPKGVVGLWNSWTARIGERRLHLFGLVSDGGVHSQQAHLYALLKMAKQQGVDRVFVHAFMDGRDTLPTNGAGYLQQLQQRMREYNSGKIASVNGPSSGVANTASDAALPLDTVSSKRR